MLANARGWQGLVSQVAISGSPSPVFSWTMSAIESGHCEAGVAEVEDGIAFLLGCSNIDNIVTLGSGRVVLRAVPGSESPKWPEPAARRDMK